MDQIGRCIGCNKPTRLDNWVCKDCLNHPKRGRKWALMSYACRTEPKFASFIYSKLKTEGGRQIFIDAYGLPDGAPVTPVEAPVEPAAVATSKLRLV